ncbi:MAG: tetratricopeptide repeat protein [Sandaracinaceae bacterium]|nr:tetratricopeptide repeat protein [Sandaracinaceae bacterium]
MWIRKKEDEVRALHDEALARIDQGDLAGAESIASQLEAIGWSGCFEVRALARRKAGDRSGALAELDRGLSLAPDLWMLHQLRGNVLDELGQKHAAIEAFDRALRCPEASSSSIRFNRAITKLSVGDAGGALADAEHVITEAPEAPFAGAALGIAVDALLALGRHDDAVSIVDRAIASIREAGADAAIAMLEGTRAKAMLAAGRAREEIEAALGRAIDGGGASRDVADVLAALAADDELSRTRFHVVIEVSLPASERASLPEGATGYFRTMRVIAASEDEARTLATSLEPRALLATSRVHTLEVEAADPATRSRIVAPSGRLYFGE